MAVPKLNCPFAAVVVNANPSATELLTKDGNTTREMDEVAPGFEPNFGVAMAFSSETKFECVRERLMAAMEEIGHLSWASHVHALPYVIQPMLEQLEEHGRDLCLGDRTLWDETSLFMPLLGLCAFTFLSLISLWCCGSLFILRGGKEEGAAGGGAGEEGGNGIALGLGDYQLSSGAGVEIKAGDLTTVIAKLPPGPAELRVLETTREPTSGRAVARVQCLGVEGWIELEGGASSGGRAERDGAAAPAGNTGPAAEAAPGGDTSLRNRKTPVGSPGDDPSSAGGAGVQRVKAE
jgi:hypothetical protein